MLYLKNVNYNRQYSNWLIKDVLSIDWEWTFRLSFGYVHVPMIKSIWTLLIDTIFCSISFYLPV